MSHVSPLNYVSPIKGEQGRGRHGQGGWLGSVSEERRQGLAFHPNKWQAWRGVAAWKKMIIMAGSWILRSLCSLLLLALPSCLHLLSV